jgi:polyketide biosynthesis enoyl-CoA hydratase PksI
VIGEECIYNAIFMKYGFTPGMGATYIVPKRMGSTLGAEMLFTARNYRGLELKARGAHVHVVKKADVIRHAMDAAQELATKPAQSLKSLKRHLTGPMKADLATAIAGERAMHEQSFAHPEVRARIERFF